MVKAVGIDPGTGSMDIYGFDDVTGEVLIDKPIPRDEITENPGIVLDSIREIERDHGKIDAIVGPSGYGLPLAKASEVSDSDILEATFITQKDLERRLKIVGLRELMFLMKKTGDLNIWFTPGVIHLPTVPGYRKANRIDMGTADKVFSVVLGIKDQAEFCEIAYPKTSFILLEIGFGYTAALGVEGGRIVDGIGGTLGGLGYMGMGALDGELAYALANTKEFSKLDLFRGGAVSISGLDPSKTSIEDFIKQSKTSKPMETAYEAFMESIVKDVYSLLPSVKKPREILLSGRFTRIESFLQDLRSRLGDHLKGIGLKPEIRNLQGNAENVKEAAEGASILANGVAGGKYSKLVDVLELKESHGSIFDHIRLGEDVVEGIKSKFTENF
jgi:predicted butyrate kinase (DUF1464 family)